MTKSSAFVFSFVSRFASTLRAAGVAATLGCASLAQAGSFDVGVAPARFELSAKSGQRLGQTLEIFNQDSQPTELSVRTLDWTYSDQGEIKYFDELLPNSCRPWFTLERRVIKVNPRSKAAFRFQVEVPADAPKTECRIMLAIEGVQPAYESTIQSGGASMSLPVNGRIAVAVYVGINGAQAVLVVQQASTEMVAGQRLPAVIVTNNGTAHGRIEGALDAKDASGQSFELVPDNFPIMPGQTRTIVLNPRATGGAAGSTERPKVNLPITSSGSLDWDNGSFKINAEFK